MLKDFIGGFYDFFDVTEEQRTSTHHNGREDEPVPLSDRVEKLLKDELQKNDTEEILQEVHIPTVFNWHHGGRKVFLVTSLDGWEKKFPMSRSQSDFSKILDLPTGRQIQYRFEVDGRLLCDPEQKHVRAADGGFVNEIVVETTCHASFQRQHSADGKFTQQIPDPDIYLREPPNGPHHLGQILLNTKPPKGRNPLVLPVASHVTLDHVYVAERKAHDVVVLGLTQRYAQKSYTTVYYKHIDSIPPEFDPTTVRLSDGNSSNYSEAYFNEPNFFGEYFH